MVGMMKQLKNHPPRSRADLQGILPPYALQKSNIGRTTKQSSCRAHIRGIYDLFWYYSTPIFKLWIWAPVLLSVVLLLWAWHLRTDVYLGTNSYTTFILLSLYWQNALFPTAALVLQYVSNQANRQRLLPGLRPEDLVVLRYWDVTWLKLPMFLKSLEQNLRTTKRK